MPAVSVPPSMSTGPTHALIRDVVNSARSMHRSSTFTKRDRHSQIALITHASQFLRRVEGQWGRGESVASTLRDHTGVQNATRRIGVRMIRRGTEDTGERLTVSFARPVVRVPTNQGGTRHHASSAPRPSGVVIRSSVTRVWTCPSVCTISSGSTTVSCALPIWHAKPILPSICERIAQTTSG